MSMITFTDSAREMVQSFVDQSQGEDLALRIGMSGSPASPTFDLTLVSLAEQADEEIMVDGGGFVVLVREEDADELDGAIVDYVERVNESGFEVRPAKLPVASAGTRGAPTGEIADRVRNVLDTQVNPAIAAHGGMISLVDVEETDVYVEMSGGCQGCALSRMTLRQGVERMLREAVPELTAVHDVTDHASGDNPYL
jgi:Fe/S biogenesis protein NfuA